MFCIVYNMNQVTHRQTKWSSQPSTLFRPAANIYQLFAVPKYVQERLSLRNRFQNDRRVESFMKFGYCQDSEAK